MKITDVILKESEESDELVGEFLDYLDQKNYWEAFNSLIGAYDTDRDCLQSWWSSFDDMKPEIMKGLLTAIKNESDLPLESIIADMYADLKWPELVIVQKALMYNKQQKAVGEAYDPDADPVIGYVQDMYQDLSRGHTDLIVLSLRDYIYDTGSPENLARAIQEIKPELVDLIQKNKHDIIKSMLGMVKKDYEHASNLLFPVFKVLDHLGIYWPECARIATALSHGTKNKSVTESTEQIPAAEILRYVKHIHPEGEFNIDYVITDHPFWTEANVPVSSLHIFDPEQDDIYDPYNRVQDTDLYHVDRLIPNIAAILQNKPLVIDDAGYILDGNHRALAAEKAGLQTVPVYKPVPGQQGVAEHIVKVKGGYELKSKKTGKNLGKYPTRAGAEKRERQVQYFKHAGESVDLAASDAPRVPALIKFMDKKLSDNLRNVFQFVIEFNGEPRMSDPDFRRQVLAVFDKHKPEILHYMLHYIKHSDGDNVKWLAPGMIKIGIDWPELKTIDQALNAKRPDRAVSEAQPSEENPIRDQLNAWMNQDQQYHDPTQRKSFQAKVWPFIQKNMQAILADKGPKDNGDYPAAPYAAWLLVQHMDAFPQNQVSFYNQLAKAIPNHPKIQFLKDRAAVNAWIQKNANKPKYYYKGKPLPDPTVNVRNPAMFKDAAVKAASRKQALTNAKQAGNKLLVAAVKATNAQTQPSYTQQTESVEEADEHKDYKILSDMMARDFAEHPVRGFYMMLYHLNELELTVADMPELKPLVDRVKPDVIRALLQSVKADNDGMNISNALQILDRMQNCGVDWPEIDKIRQGLQHGRQETTEGIDEIESERLKFFVNQIQQPLASKTGWLAAQTLEDLASVAISKSYSDNRFTDADYAEAAALLNLNSHKEVLIKGILENIKQNIKNGNSTTWLAENLAMQKHILNKLGCNWPELDRIAAAVAHNAN